MIAALSLLEDSKKTSLHLRATQTLCDLTLVIVCVCYFLYSRQSASSSDCTACLVYETLKAHFEINWHSEGTNIFLALLAIHCQSATSLIVPTTISLPGRMQLIYYAVAISTCQVMYWHFSLSRTSLSPWLLAPFISNLTLSSRMSLKMIWAFSKRFSTRCLNWMPSSIPCHQSSTIAQFQHSYTLAHRFLGIAPPLVSLLHQLLLCQLQVPPFQLCRMLGVPIVFFPPLTSAGPC